VNQEQMRITEVQAPANLYPGFMHFSLAALVAGSSAPCSIRLEAFNKSLGRLRLVEALMPGDTIRESWLAPLLGEGVGQGYIALEDLPAMQAYLHAQTLRLVEKDPEQANRLVYENALCAIKSAMLDPKNGRRLAMAAATAHGMLQHFWNYPSARQDIFKLMTLSRELYAHSVNVCLLGLGLAMAMGWEHDQVASLGLALLFHDLGLAEETASPEGYRSICLENDEAYNRHPEESAICLQSLPEATPELLDIVRCHHENLDGSGYPRGLKGEALSPPARLARVVDLYDLATLGCISPQRLSPFAALQYMRYEMRHKLDQKIVGSLVLFLGQA
jgi:HD-GYP domain-containing protein (c-di-GMP phosphodiesterase class II)